MSKIETVSRTEIIKLLAGRISGNEDNPSEDNIKQATEFCDNLVDIFIDSFLKNKKIIWRGFLSAEVVERGERKAKNLHTNKIELFPPVKLVKFKISKELKEIINGK